MKNHTPVIIIGGGPVGLSMAIGLSEQGIASTVIEKHPSTTAHPKARGVNGRSMEIFRTWGLEPSMRQYQMPYEAHRFIWLEDFQGEEITRVQASIDYSQYSPTSPAVIAQDSVEHELFLKAQQSPLINLLFNTLMTKTSQSEHEVTVEIQDRATDNLSIITSDYLVAADGANSGLREQFNIQMQGKDNLGEFCNIYCEMDLDQYVANRRSVGFMFTREDLWGTFMLAKGEHKKWLIGIRLDPEQGHTKDMFTDEYCINIIKNIIRDDSVQIRLINKAFWTMAALLADKYRVGRVFFAGDAAHRLPPTGGFGMNTGIQDSHNLAWKMAMVIQGHADDSLLDSYFDERAPIAHTNISWSSHNAQRFTTIFTALAEHDIPTFKQALLDQNKHLNNIQLDLGFIYGQDYLSALPYQPSTHIGARAPHCALIQSEQKLSTIDLFQTQFILLCHPEAKHWQSIMGQFNQFPMSVVTIGKDGDYEAVEDDFLSTYNLTKQGAVLVRPDGHIAWKADDETATAFEPKDIGLRALKEQ